jgi:membrane protein required for beta-lactamase induction
MMAEMDRVGIAQEALSQINRWIEIADAKARVLLSIAIFLIGIAVLRLPGLRAWYELNPTTLFWIAAVLATIGMGGLALSIHFSVRVAYPRRDATSKHRSMFFFEHIAAEELTKLRDAFRNKSKEEVVDELVDQIWNVAQVAKVKFDLITKAANAAYAGGIAALLFLLMVELLGFRTPPK